MEDQIRKFIDKVKSEHNIPDQKLLESIKRVLVPENISFVALQKNGTCQASTKKGIVCGAKTPTLYCKRHSGKEPPKEEEDKSQVCKKNQFGYFTLGETGLIFKNATEKFIIGKQLDDGSIHPLSETDINLCIKFKLKYKSVGEIVWPSIDTNKEPSKSEEIISTDTTKYTAGISLY